MGNSSSPTDAPEQTLVLLKPDAIERGLVGRILARFEDADLEIQALQTTTPSRELVAEHYTEHQDEPFFDGLLEYLSETTIIAGMLGGDDAVATVRELIGATEPVAAEKGTIRGDLGDDSYQAADAEDRALYNLVHASEDRSEAQRELELWFDGVPAIQEGESASGTDHSQPSR
ncbi:nucleoside-diphosphate kinase [Halomontanus rarus]|uniref:nucleoside-diphosphate kinase n=1 Tax=Halomontanus rarus TaxID=3034020 RepID=UPI001A97FFF6